MKRLATVFFSFSLISVVQAQTFSEYLKLRQKHGITQAVGATALAGLRGTKFVELQGMIKGSFDSNGEKTLVFERTDGESILIEAKSAPEWLLGTDVAARLLVEVTRQFDGEQLKARLVSAASETQVRQVEEEYWRREAAKRSAANDLKNQRTTSGLYGPIGRTKGSQASRKGAWRLPTSEATPIYARFIKNHNKRLTDEKAWEIAANVVGFSIRFGVDARLIMAVLITESDFNPATTSRKGAMGLGQLMPVNVKELGLTNGYDTSQNLYGTIKLLRGHLEDYQGKNSSSNALVLALAAYNAGPGAVRKHGGVPPYRETQNYVKKVVAIYRQLVGS